MVADGIVFTRKELYDMATEKSMTALSKELGFSAKLLSDTLEMNGIPMRSSKDWAIIRSGRPVLMKPLRGDPSKEILISSAGKHGGKKPYNQTKLNNYPSISSAKLFGGSDTASLSGVFKTKRGSKPKERFSRDGQLLRPGEYERDKGGFEYRWRENGVHRSFSSTTLEGLRAIVESYNEVKEEVSKRRSPKHDAFCTDAFDNFSGIDFECYCRDLLLSCGFTSVETTSRHNDDGVDLVANLCDITFVIQCKRYADVVTKKAIQEVYAGKAVHNADVAVVITNSAFTRDAISTAEVLNVKLWNGAHLKEVAMRASVYAMCVK